MDRVQQLLSSARTYSVYSTSRRVGQAHGDAQHIFTIICSWEAAPVRDCEHQHVGRARSLPTLDRIA